jgi:hypothetical protein
MDILIWSILTGAAVGFTVELINNTRGNWFWWFPSARSVRLWSTLPLSYGALYLLGVSFPSIVVATLAAGFFSNTLLLLIDRASIVNIRR